ncbi:hypothetical protein [Haloplanus pelagicus]|uniref:hypothetical protein n=1 Tax=Haloplanus pelagicus TaxID=2949995 RepID=UPI00203EAD09|nr:hypothetical protein [Haloplanus sp. HW8-1]
MGSGERHPFESIDDADGGDDANESGESSPDGTWGRRELALAALAVVVIAGAATLLVGSLGGTTAGGGDAGTNGATATATPTPETTGTAASTPAVTMRVRSIETCGTRCRTVTIALSNDGDDAARSVRVTTEITTGGSLIWEGKSDVGRLPAGETVTRTRTIRVGYVDAARIESNDGRIRVETTVRTASGTRVFTEHRTVS